MFYLTFLMGYSTLGENFSSIRNAFWYIFVQTEEYLKIMKINTQTNGFRAGTFAAAVALVLTALASNVSATSLPILIGGGVLNLSNLTGQLVGVTAGCINWGQPAACQTVTGIQDTVSGSDSGLFQVGSNASDTIKNLPAGVPTPLVDFLTVEGGSLGLGQVFFDLNNIVIPGAFGTCNTFAVNNVCNPGGNSPFVLFQSTPTQISVTFAVTASAYTGTSASGTTDYDGIFSTTLSGNLANGTAATIPNLLNFFAGGGAVNATWSATLSPTVPEPGTWMLLGLGLIALGSLRKVKRSKA